MIRKIKATIFCLIAVSMAVFPFICVSAAEMEQMSGLVYGDDYSFWIDAPKGWVLDPKAAKKYGVNVVLYQTGFSFGNSPAVMYANTLTGKDKIEEVMKHEADTYKEQYEGIQISRRPEMKTKDNKSARVQYYKGKKKDQTDEAVAFIQEKGFYALLVLSAKSTQDFNAAYPAFEWLVQSYALSDIKVHDNTKRVEHQHPADRE